MVDLHYQTAATVEDVADFDFLGDDPLEWLIETDCTQEYLPESSLPFLPFTADATKEDEEQLRQAAPEPEAADMVEDALLHNMVDPHVTMQSLFMPTDDIMQP